MDVDQAKEVRRRTHLAMEQKAECTACGRVGDINEMVVVAFRGNVMLAMHTECVNHEGFQVYRDGDALAARVARPAARKGDLWLPRAALKKPHVDLGLPKGHRFEVGGEA